MKFKIYTSVIALAFSVFGINAQKINIQKSTLEWIGKKIGGQHNGEIQLNSGEIKLANNKIESGFFSMDMKTITCTDLEDPGYNQKLVGHLKSDDFFGVEKHPTANFNVTNSTSFKNSKATLKGNLTIKGVTQKISFEVTKSENVLTANLDVDRSKYNVKYGSNSFFDSLGDAAIDDVFKLKIKLITNK
tara:strand:+ start:1276 stop:1842 length:567 start_codon:yes stop_codon:yes gene_type:complete